MYRTNPHRGNYAFGNCNYYLITGKTKQGSLPKGEKYDPEHCQFYVKGRRQNGPIDPPFAKTNSIETVREAVNIDSQKCFELYDLRLCDEDIAMLLRTIPRAVAKWRKQRGLIRRGVAERRIEWEKIKPLLPLLSDETISESFEVDVKIIRKYRKFVEEEENE